MKWTVNEEGNLPVDEVVIQLQHTELGVLVYEKAYVEGRPYVTRNLPAVTSYASYVMTSSWRNRLLLISKEVRRPGFGTVPNIAMAIDIRDGFAVHRVAKQLRGISDYCLVGIGVSFASGRGNRFTEMSEARLPMVFDDLVDTTDH